MNRGGVGALDGVVGAGSEIRSGVERVLSFTAMSYGFNLTLTPAQFANGGSSKANHDSRLL